MKHSALRFWLWLKILCHCIRHTTWWRFAWAAAVVLGLLGWELLRHMESHAKSTTLTLLFRPGFEEADIREFLKTLPQAPESVLREPKHLLAEAERLLKKLGHASEEAWPKEEAIGWAAQLRWIGLSPELTQQLRGHLEKTPWVEEAYWAAPTASALPGLWRIAFVLFVLSTGGLGAMLSLGCLNAEASHLRVLLELGASFSQVRNLWLGQGLLWAALSGMFAHVLWRLFIEALGAPEAFLGPYAFVALGTALGGTSLFLAFATRGRTCWP